jgi:hypothetical protein
MKKKTKRAVAKRMKKTATKRATRRLFKPTDRSPARAEAAKIPFIRDLSLTDKKASKILIESYVVGSTMANRSF